jgi:benzil reductase ((S)-benzoin forming)
MAARWPAKDSSRYPDTERIDIVENVIVTGASRGFGHAVAQQMLDRGYRVYGLSRSIPGDLVRRSDFHYVPIDLFDTRAASGILVDYFLRERKLGSISHLFLNAGMFGDRVAKTSDIPLEELKQTIDLNLWANKVVLDTFINAAVSIDTCIVSASMAGVRVRAGNGGYAISKAALHVMMRLYALEHPSIFFAVLGLCSLDTYLFDRIMAPLASPQDFQDVANLQQRARIDGYLTSPDQRAKDVDLVLNGPLRQRLVSGEMVDMRAFLASAAAAPNL